jgi:hypothetical protein
LSADADQQPLDPRQVLLARAAARFALFELGELDLDEACEGLIDMDWTFWRACELADAEAARKPLDPAIARARRLLADDISLDRAWHELNDHRATPEATLDAIKAAVQARGIAALNEPATRERLQQCDADARAAIEQWLSQFQEMICDERICQESTRNLEHAGCTTDR